MLLTGSSGKSESLKRSTLVMPWRKLVLMLQKIDVMPFDVNDNAFRGLGTMSIQTESLMISYSLRMEIPSASSALVGTKLW